MVNPHFRRSIGIAFLVSSAVLLGATQPWTKDQSQWTASDLDRILGASPWAQTADASFAITGGDEEDPRAALPPPAATTTMAGRRGITDGAWDGGVGRMPRGGTPTLPVMLRWESALPIRQALSKGDSKSTPYSDRAAKEYVVSIQGLVAASKTPGSDPVEAQRMLEGVMATSRLSFRGHMIRPDDAKLDSKTGELYLFFPRTEPIVEKDKEVRFDARYGSLSVAKVFRLRDMTYKGQLEL